MARYTIDVEGVSRARAALSHDPIALRECATRLNTAASHAATAVGADSPELRAAVERFGYLHAYALDAVADATSALVGRVDLAAIEAREVEVVVAAAFATSESAT